MMDEKSSPMFDLFGCTWVFGSWSHIECWLQDGRELTTIRVKINERNKVLLEAVIESDERLSFDVPSFIVHRPETRDRLIGEVENALHFAKIYTADLQDLLGALKSSRDTAEESK